MKKIFAFILASIMVLSLVPASAFAAITKEEGCPDPHTVANCESTIVKTVAATCGENGYTIFKCNKCGEQFIGNVVAGGDHVWVSDPENADDDVAPNCKKLYEDGETIGELNQICSECGETRLHYVTEAEYHAANGVWVSGVGCEAIYKCLVCEDTFNVNGGEVGEHEGWELVEVLSEPVYSAGKKTSGVALFACTNDDCKATKKVEILAECSCASIANKDQVNFFKLVLAGQIVKTSNAKNPTCTADGKYALYKCSDCNTVYRWETDDVWKPATAPELAENENGTEYVKGGKFVKITDTSTGSGKYASAISSTGAKTKGTSNNDYKTKYYTIKKPGHQKDTSIAVIDNGCNGKVYTCKLCKQQFTEDGHSWYETLVLLPTCETYGITYKSCTACGKTESKVTNPLGHNIQTYTYPSTCGSYGYTITYCKNAGVQKYKEAGQSDKNVPKCEYTNMTLGIGDDTDDHGSAVSYTDPKTGITYPDVRVGKKLYPIISITPLGTLAGAHKMTTVNIIGGGNTTNCATSYVVVEQCEICQFINYRQVAGKGHELVKDKAASYDATCAAPGMLVSKCKNCEYVDYAVIPQLTTHTTTVTNVQYVCATTSTTTYTVQCNTALKVRPQPSTEGTAVAELANGTVIYPINSVVVGQYTWYQINVSATVSGWVRGDYVVTTSTGSSFFFNPADGHYYHGIGEERCACGLINTTKYIDKVGGTTANVWFDSIEDAKVYHGEGINENAIISSRLPTCDTDGYAIYKCTKCGISVYVIIEAEGHVPTGTVVPGTKPTCTAPGLKDYYTCGKCYVSIILKDGEWVKVTANELVLNPHTDPATLEEVKVYACDGITYVSYWKCTAKDANNKECGKIFADEACTKPVDKIPEGGIHTWNTLYAGTTLTCNTDGYPSIRYCATCKTLERVQFVEALDENGKVVIEILELPEGTNADTYLNYYDVQTGVEEYELPLYINYVNGVIDVSAYKVPKLSHGEAEAKLDGTNKVSVYAGTKWAGIFDHENYKGELVCGESYGYTGHVCLLCGYEYINEFESAAEGHRNVYGEILEATCENYAKYAERYCVVCEEPIGADASIHNMATDEEEFIEVEASCISEGYVFTYCTNDGCTFVDVVSTTPKIEAKKYHSNTANLTSTKPQDYAHNGDVIWTCNACGEVVKVDTAKEYNLPAGFEIYANTDYTKYAVGSFVDVVISVDSLKGVDVWAFDFQLYAGTLLEYVGHEFNTAATGWDGLVHVVKEDTYETVYNETTEKYEDKYLGKLPTGMLNIVVNSKEGIEITDAQDVLVITFKVVGAPRWSGIPNTVMTMNAEAVAPNGKDVKVNANNMNVSNQFFINPLFDLNNDGDTTIADAYELYALIELGGYNVLGDVNNNGINDAFDLNELYQYLIGAKTANEILTGEEEEERVITYDENGNVTYDSLYDLNDDGVLTAYEIAVMTGKIDPDLNPST